jgi:V8-like Glu-specific endopeptidase
LWIKRFQRVSEENQRLMMKEYESYKFAERVYDNDPRKAKHVAVAQKIYDDKPIQARNTRYAHGAIECKTQMSLGSTVYAQGDFVQVEQATQTLMHSSVWLQCVDEDGIASRSNGCFLVGRTLVTTAHTVLSPPGKSKFSYIAIYNPYQEKPSIKVPYDACNISQMKQKDGELVDLALISFPPVVSSRRRITSRFIDSNQFERCTDGELVFTAFSEIGGKIGVVEKYPSKFSTSSRATHYLLHQPGTCPKDPKMCQCPIKISNHVTYEIDTKNGMCGALLTVKNNAISSKLIGFHTAGGKGVSGMGVFTSKQFIEFNLETHVKSFNIPETYLIDGRLPYSQSLVDPSKKVSYVHEGDCLSVGTAQPPLVPVKSQIKKSLIHNEVMETKMAPALLAAKVVTDTSGKETLLDPMTKGIQKLLGQQTWIPKEYLDEAVNDVFNGIQYKSDTKVHSYEEAIKGVEGDPLKQPIKRNTSPGYPYNLTNKMKGKTAWLGADEEYIVDNPELKADVENLITKAKNCIRGDAISMATLKDEKRPLEKVLIGKTRVFEACPQHLVIAIRQYFLDFVAHVMEHRIGNGIAVGINPYSLEWTKVADHLLYMGDNMVAGDFSNFDGSLMMQVLVRICEKINDWYGDGEENARIRMTLWEHVCNADVIIGREIIRQTHSQPSGNPLTVIINSLFNAIIMRVAYLKLKKDQGLPVVCDYRNYVREIIYGDDDIKSIHISILNWFNQETITKALAGYGLTYTDETKKTNSTSLAKSIKDVSFLKRRFVRDDCCNYIAPMEIENILEITNWVKGNNVREDTKENCKHVFVELALHDEHTYDHWVRIIRIKCQEKGLQMFPPTWKAQRLLYLYNPNNNAFYNPFF